MSQRRPLETQIFMSHSQKDESLQKSFDQVCAREGVISKCMEFEQIQFPNQWASIREEIKKSFVVFLLLGRNVVSSVFTRNWIAFEVGIACGKGKDVWEVEGFLTMRRAGVLKDRKSFRFQIDAGTGDVIGFESVRK